MHKTVFWLKNSIFVILLVLCFIELLLSSLWNWNYHYEIYSIDSFVFFFIFSLCSYVFCLSSNHQTDWYFLQTKIPSGCMKINIFTFQFRSVFLAFLPLNNGKSIYIPSYFSCCGGKNKWFQGKYRVSYDVSIYKLQFNKIYNK